LKPIKKITGKPSVLKRIKGTTALQARGGFVDIFSKILYPSSY